MFPTCERSDRLKGRNFTIGAAEIRARLQRFEKITMYSFWGFAGQEKTRRNSMMLNYLKHSVFEDSRTLLGLRAGCPESCLSLLGSEMCSMNPSTN